MVSNYYVLTITPTAMRKDTKIEKEISIKWTQLNWINRYSTYRIKSLVYIFPSNPKLFCDKILEKCYNFTQGVKLERKLYRTGKFRYFCARQNPTDQKVWRRWTIVELTLFFVTQCVFTYSQTFGGLCSPSLQVRK